MELAQNKIVVEKKKWQLNELATNAFLFYQKEKKTSNSFAIFTHGYTSHKGDLLSWAHCLVLNNIPTLIFDLPGHYLGGFNEVSSLSSWIENAPYFFISALEIMQEKNIANGKCFIGGHSLGGLLSIKSLALPEFKNATAIAVGVGLKPDNKQHVFHTSLFESTLQLRSQFVSPAIGPDNMLPWIEKEKQNGLGTKNARIHLITGLDDIVVGNEGTKHFANILKQQNNNVSIDEPSKLSHHQPEKAASFIYSFINKY